MESNLRAWIEENEVFGSERKIRLGRREGARRFKTRMVRKFEMSLQFQKRTVIMGRSWGFGDRVPYHNRRFVTNVQTLGMRVTGFR